MSFLEEGLLGSPETNLGAEGGTLIAGVLLLDIFPKEFKNCFKLMKYYYYDQSDFI